MRRILIAAAAALALPLIMTAQANAAVPASHPAPVRPATPAVSGDEVCDLGAGYLCLNDVGDATTGGTPINLNSGGPDYAGEFWLVEPYSLSGCGSKVTTANGGCPFVDSAFDSTFNGDQIVHIELGSHTSGCAAAQGDPPFNVALEGCSDPASAWVEVNNPKGGFGFVNVADTNNYSSLLALSGSSTAGDQASIDDWVDGYLQGWTW
jgi:hypothetical protein